MYDMETEEASIIAGAVYDVSILLSPVLGLFVVCFAYFLYVREMEFDESCVYHVIQHSRFNFCLTFKKQNLSMYGLIISFHYTLCQIRIFQYSFPVNFSTQINSSSPVKLFIMKIKFQKQ